MKYITNKGVNLVEKITDKTAPMLAKMILTGKNKKGSKVNPMKAIKAANKAGIEKETSRIVRAANEEKSGDQRAIELIRKIRYKAGYRGKDTEPLSTRGEKNIKDKTKTKVDTNK